MKKIGSKVGRKELYNYDTRKERQVGRQMTKRKEWRKRIGQENMKDKEEGRNVKKRKKG